MEPYWTNDIATLYLSNALSLPIPDESVDCVVASPPYWGLRDYGTATWEGGDSDCSHKVGRYEYEVSSKQKRNSGSAGHQAKTVSWIGGDDGCDHQGTVLGNNRNFVDREGRGSNTPSLESDECSKCDAKKIVVCPLCGAERVDKQIGLESTPDEYCNSIVNVFREARRVLKPTGTVWLNLGDSYAGSGRGPSKWNPAQEMQSDQTPPKGIKPKDLVGIPWRVAFALQADGWYLRSDII